MNPGKKLKKALWLLPALLAVPALFASAALTGQQIYDQQCAGCHSLGTYDTSGSPNLLGLGSTVTSRFTGGQNHHGVTLTATDITSVAAFVNNPTPAPAPVSVTTSSLANGTVGNAYSQTLAATGGTTPYKWSISSGSLPAGLTLSTTGVISGTPTTAATVSLTVKVTDSATTAATATKALSITVAAAAPGPLAISTSTLSAATVGTAYSQTLSATGGTSPYKWSVSSGTLPTGLTLGTTGVISGTPTTAATSSFTVKVTDSATTAATSTKALSITVASAPAASPVSITTTSLANGTTGTAYSQTLAATGGVPPYTWSYSGTLPPGIGLTSAGSITGTPTTAGTYSFTARAIDTKSTAATQALSLIISAAARTTMTTADKNLFINNCLNCHTPTGVQNSTPSQISAAISGNVGGMGTTQLKSLSSTDLNNIADALSPTPKPAWNCNTCHSSTTSSSGTGTTSGTGTSSGTGTTTLTAAQSAGKTVYDGKCAVCHALGTYDTSGSPNLSGTSSLVSGRFTGGQNHHGVTLSATDITNVTAFIALY